MDTINQKIIELWESEAKNKKPPKCVSRIPQFFLPSPKSRHGKSLLYAGMNPSFSYKNFRWARGKASGPHKKLLELVRSSREMETFYSWDRTKITKKYLEQTRQMGRVFLENHSYFSTAHKIARDLKYDFQATDLFLGHETSQASLKTDIFSNKKWGALTNFAKRQIEIFFDIVQYVNPSVILVGNALASSILKEYMGTRLQWNNKLGTYVLEMNGRKIPTFLSSMLSGQRALDVYSRERLEWHIKYCLREKLKS